MRISLVILGLALMMGCASGPSDIASTPVQPVPKANLAWPDCKGSVTLSLSTNVITIDKAVLANCLFLNVGPELTVYNPYLCSLSPLPVMLLLCDKNRKPFANLWTWTGGSMIYGGTDWIKVPTGGQIGIRKEFVIPSVHPKISPGIHYLQLVYFCAFVTTSPPSASDHDPRMGPFVTDRRILFRSNLVRIELVRQKTPNQ